MASRKKKSPTKKKTQAAASNDQLLAVTADVHVGNHAAREDPPKAGLNQRCRAALDVFGRSIRVAQQRGAGLYAVAGDLIHQRRPEPAVIAATNRVLEREAQTIPTVVIPGNHEMLDATASEGNTACEPLYAQATVPRDPEWFPLGEWASVLAVPFTSEAPMADYLEVVLKRYKDDTSGRQKILVTHVGVFDEASPHWLRGNDAIRVDSLLEFLGANGFTAAFVGNFHQHQVWKRDGLLVCQVGTLCPASYSDEGVFPNVGGMALYDGKEVDLVEIPGPRYVKLDGADSVEELLQRHRGSTFHVRAPSAEGFDNIPDVLLDVAEERKVEPAAQATLPQAEDAGEAIENFVQEMELDDGVERPAVLKTARDFWTKAAP